jgi:hypothetical protein
MRKGNANVNAFGSRSAVWLVSMAFNLRFMVPELVDAVIHLYYCAYMSLFIHQAKWFSLISIVALVRNCEFVKAEGLFVHYYTE